MFVICNRQFLDIKNSRSQYRDAFGACPDYEIAKLYSEKRKKIAFTKKKSLVGFHLVVWCGIAPGIFALAHQKRKMLKVTRIKVPRIREERRQIIHKFW